MRTYEKINKSVANLFYGFLVGLQLATFNPASYADQTQYVKSSRNQCVHKMNEAIDVYNEFNAALLKNQLISSINSEGYGFDQTSYLYSRTKETRHAADFCFENSNTNNSYWIDDRKQIIRREKDFERVYSRHTEFTLLEKIFIQSLKKDKFARKSLEQLCFLEDEQGGIIRYENNQFKIIRIKDHSDLKIRKVIEEIANYDFKNEEYLREMVEHRVNLERTKGWLDRNEYESLSKFLGIMKKKDRNKKPRFEKQFIKKILNSICYSLISFSYWNNDDYLEKFSPWIASFHTHPRNSRRLDHDQMIKLGKDISEEIFIAEGSEPSEPDIASTCSSSPEILFSLSTTEFEVHTIKDKKVLGYSFPRVNDPMPFDEIPNLKLEDEIVISIKPDEIASMAKKETKSASSYQKPNRYPYPTRSSMKVEKKFPDLNGKINIVKTPLIE